MKTKKLQHCSGCTEADSWDAPEGRTHQMDTIEHPKLPKNFGKMRGEKKQKVVEKMEVKNAYEMFEEVAKDGGYKLAYYEIGGKTHKFIVIYQGIY